MMEASTESMNGTMWLGHSSSPSYQRLSPPVRYDVRDVNAPQQIPMGYHVSDGAILWHDKRESLKNSQHLNNEISSRDNSPTSDNQSGYQQSSNGLKRRATGSHQSITELDRKHSRRDGSNSAAQGWSSRQVEELAEHLVADFDDPLSALAANDLANAVASYNMSEALLALPSLTVFKQEAPSPENHINNNNINDVTQININGSHQDNNIGHSVEPDSNDNNNNNNTTSMGITTTTTTQPTTSSTTTNNNAINNVSNSNNSPRNVNEETGQSSTTSLHQLLYSNNDDYPPTSSSGNHVSSSQQGNEFNEDSRFQYVLAAATSIATKVNEETLTYLNQGQSYEIKLKKLGDLSAYRGKILKSNIRICFHERRLQYTEREQMLAWQRGRPGERLLEIDVPLSYGMIDVSQSSSAKNSIEFMWDPTKEVGIYIKVNCISTEFTPKKHGGEKGVPFRIQVETKLPGGPRLHAASCQIKVFKLKGADRKHKQDRDKIMRRPPHEQEKYQPSYECTVLSDISFEALSPINSSFQNEGSSYITNDSITSQNLSNSGDTSSPLTVVPVALSIATPEHQLVNNLDQSSNEETNVSRSIQNLVSPVSILPDQISCNEVNNNTSIELSADANAVQTVAWLRASRFQAFETTFTNFSAADILRLSRDDLIQICGIADGIRLFNALHSKAPTPKLRLYFAIENTNGVLIWRVIYLDNLTSGALATKLLATFNLPNDRLHSILLQGPQAIHVLVSNDVVANMKDESMFLIETIKDSSSERYKLLLKPSSR